MLSSVRGSAVAVSLRHIEMDRLQLLTVYIASSLGESFIVVALYRSPKYPLSELKALLQAHLQTLCNKFQFPIFLVGDFNADARKTAVIDVPQYVIKSTHIEGVTLDHVYWTGGKANLVTDVVPCRAFFNIQTGGGMAPPVTRLGPPSQPIRPTQSEVAYIVQHIASTPVN
jgi:hypothetical protein